MREQLEQRLHELKSEYTTGQKLLSDLETRQADLRQTLLRISGAIQVLEELLNAQPATNGVVPAPEAMPTGAGLEQAPA
jgi:hypothetical protein